MIRIPTDGMQLRSGKTDLSAAGFSSSYCANLAFKACLPEFVLIPFEILELRFANERAHEHSRVKVRHRKSLDRLT